ncbi:MAG TPA: L,D-transpeptidase family protein, partial [Desulfurivibrionaceae bacterium]|nr:L,D-transpeptidase family protein [Desulfurivibrionaceae bacterium]
QKNPRSKYHLSLGLSYPNIEHAERGLRDRLIDERQYDSIVRSITQGRIPPSNTALGGEIFIHGDGEFWQWTYGCVALRNKDIEELYPVIKVGTEVIIKK